MSWKKSALQIYETTALKEVGKKKKSADLTSFGNKWSL